VRDLLMEIASNHPEVTDGTLAPPPLVSFAAFGDSALVFELRVWVRDVTKRLLVTSDLNFAIDKAFRAGGIEIPFPQRDVHVRDWPSPPQQSGAD
jgi:small-conductance mechanosensitive channel